jgi:hypothetical protein
MLAFFLRSAAAFVHFYIFNLPDGGEDALKFEALAWEWAQNNLVAFQSQRGMYLQPFDSTFTYSWLIGALYYVTDRSPLMAQFLSVFVGVCSVVAAWVLARDLWGERAARTAAWLVCVFPTLVLYSALTLREIYIVCLVLFGMVWVLRWARTDSLVAALFALGFFGVAAFLFHGGMFIACLVFVGLVVMREGRKWLSALVSGLRLPVVSSLILAGLALGSAGIVLTGTSIPYLGQAHEMVSPQRWMYQIERSAKGEASYPEWTEPDTPEDLTWAVPIRVAYFLFSPFPWDATRLSHLMGLLDSLFYMSLFGLLVANAKPILADPGARAVAAILCALILVYAVGSGNFGTAIRHRAKLAAILIVLASPLLPKLAQYARRKRKGLSESDGNGDDAGRYGTVGRKPTGPGG